MPNPATRTRSRTMTALTCTTRRSIGSRTPVILVSEAADFRAVIVSAGEFERIYDPSVGEAEPWYLNDHTFVRGADGTWHLFGITHAEPMAPFDERHLAHASAPDLHGPWTKQPFALTAAPAWGESVLWAPHVIGHDGRWWMFVCGGGPAPTEFRIHLAVS